MEKLIRLIFILSICYSPINSGAQWFPVLDDVLPVDIAISPDYLNDQTVYVLDDNARIWISETGGAIWTTVYEADDPNDPSQAVLDIVLSPNFLNDDAIIMIHKDGTMKLSPDRGQHWLTAPAPEGVAGMVFSPRVAEDATMYCVTGALGPVNFYKSGNFGAVWGDAIAEIAIGGGYYSRLWNSLDPLARDTFAVQYENNSLYISMDGGETWVNSFGAQVKVSDFTFSPQFSDDNTMFAADASDIYRNIQGGVDTAWLNVGNFPGTQGIKFAISPGFQNDRTIFAALDQVGIIRSTDGGLSWGPFNEDFNSTSPVSIAISSSPPYSLFAGGMGIGGAPGKVYKFQAYTGVIDPIKSDKVRLSSFPNPFSDKAMINITLPAQGHVNLSISDMSGRTILVLMDKELGKGLHTCVLDNSSGLIPPGAYILMLQAGNWSFARKVMVTR